MATEDWKSDEKSEGYVRLVEKTPSGEVRIQHLQSQRPWHSKIRLPIEADELEGPDFHHLECHDLDCLIVVLRMLLSLEFTPEPEYEHTAVMTCAYHDFGWDRPADYLAKGMLLTKLFPTELTDTDIIDDIKAMLPKFTFENLLKHPGIKEVIFGSRYFLLQSPELVVINQELPIRIESIIKIPYSDMIDLSQVNWDGVKDLGETVSKQGHYIDLAAENDTKVHQRYCAVPFLIRVMFTPDKDHRRSFNDVLRFTLRAPSIKHCPNEVMEVMSNSTYLLRAVVKMDPQHPIENPAEVRLYDTSGVMMLANPESDKKYRSVMGEKNRLDSGWRLGDPDLKFMLFYLVWEGEEDATPPVPPVEYCPPFVIGSREIPQLGSDDSDDMSDSDQKDVLW